VIRRAALCPAAPLLARDLTGRDLVLPELRAACAAAVEWLLADDPDLVIVVGPGDVTAAWDPGSRFDLSVFAPALRSDKSDVPASVGLGAMLLDEAGWGGSHVLQSACADETPADCNTLGRRLSSGAHHSGAPRHVVMLVMGDGSAKRSPAAPGHFDDRAESFDATIERALRDGDLGAITRLDPSLARELMATGRPAWQVLAGALGSAGPADVLYADAPFGVCYFVATLDAT
jgi:hypothetical protein